MADHIPPISRVNFQDRWLERSKGGRSPLADGLLRRMALASPILCAHLLLEGPKRPPFHGRFLYGQVHLEWDRILTRQRRFAVMAPRGIGKSEVFSFAYPIWQMIRNKQPCGLLVSSVYDNAQRILQKIRDEIENNVFLRFLLPARTNRQWNNKQITAANGHQLFSRSCLSRIRGLHPHYIIGDDVLTDDAKHSAVYRRKTKMFWYGVIEPAVIPGGSIGLIGTPMATTDLIFHELRINPSYRHYSFPILNGQGESLWPEMFPLDYIASQKKTIGSTMFTTEMMVQPVSDETSMLPKSLMLGPPQEQYTFTMGMAAEYLAPLGLSYFMGVDLAFSATASADYFVICVIGIDAQQNHWIVDMYRSQGVPYHQQFSLVNKMGRQYACQRIYVEANQAQSILGNELIRNTSLPVKKYTMTAKKHDLQAGLPSLRRLAENQKWRLPRGDARSIEQTEIILDELAGFTFVGGKVISVGAHDDTTSALYLAVEAARAGRGFNFGQGPKMPLDKPLPGVAGVPEGPKERPRGNFGAGLAQPVIRPWERR